MVKLVNSESHVDSEIENNPNDHVPSSVGGLSGHIFRRMVHVGMIIIPVLYYYWDGVDFFASLVFNSTKIQFVSIMTFVLVIVEIIRLRFGLVVFGQRDYESNQISAFFWGGFSICLVLLLAPEYGFENSAFGMPLIISLSLVDPLMGELRRANFSSRTVSIIGYIGGLIIWLNCSIFLDTPFVIAPFISALIVASEWPRLTWIDDNATMLLIPLTLILVTEPFLV